ncbi:hypothetical protein PG997_011701 [Apiospora hydei]|uniref:Suppressor of anucleate metulae protein B n=1 Tax=Apiospora hydei TaxID=1337664 RepID=A0ABR1VJU5_9PEZI
MDTPQIVDGNPPHEAYAKAKPEVLNACIMCENPGHLACATCKSRYCSQACQKQDWKYRKMLRKSSVGPEYHLDSRPGPDYRRVIVFPHQQEAARLGLGPLPRRHGWTHFPRIRPAPPAPSNPFVNMSVSLNSGNKNPYLRFGRGLQYFSLGEMDQESIPRSSPYQEINQSALSLTKPGHATPASVHSSSRPSRATRLVAPSSDMASSGEDTTLKDFRLFVDSIITDKANPCIIDPDRYALKLTPNVNSEVWPALKLNCRADMERFGLQREEAIEPVLVSSIPLTGKRHNVGLVESMGLSWAWQEATISNSSIRGSRELLRTDQDFGFFFKGVELPEDITLFNFQEVVQNAFDSMRHKDVQYTGTIMLVHKKGRAIQRAHLQAVMQYKDLVWAEGIEGLDSGRLPRTPSPNFMSSRLTREKFEAFWNNVWGSFGVPSPYTLED